MNLFLSLWRPFKLLSGLFLVLSTFSARAQCPTGPLTLNSQAEVAAFPPGCSTLPQSLRIQGEDIVDLGPLGHLQTIGGTLSIADNPRLVSLRGLQKLRAVRGSLTIASNPLLSSLEGLSQLNSIGHYLDLNQNPKLTSLAGLEKLRTIAGGLNVLFHERLSSIRALGQASIQGFVNISYNPQLTSLAGLEKLRQLPEGLFLESNERLGDISALSQVRSITGELRIINNWQLSHCAYPAICQHLAIPPDITRVYNNAPGCSSIQDLLDHCPAAPRVLSFSLIDADTDQPLQLLVLTANEEIDLARVPQHLNIRANTSAEPVGSVSLVLSGPVSRTQVENQAPYAVFGDQKGAYHPAKLPPGYYTLRATVYAGPYATGTALAESTQYFEVINSSSTAPGVVSYSLMDADTDQPIGELSAGDELNLASLPGNLAIRANTSPASVGSVKLVLGGRQSRTQLETGAPYSLFGDTDGDYRAWTPAAGSYTLTASAYTGPSASGQPGKPLTISFRVVAQTPPARVGVQDNTQAVRVYPNPFQESFRLKSPGQGPLKLYDLSGRKVFEVDTVQQEQLIKPGAGLAPGIYYLEVGEGLRVERRKLLKVD